MKKVCPAWDGGRWKTAARSTSPAGRSRERPNQACQTDRRDSFTKGLISPIGPIRGVQTLELDEQREETHMTGRSFTEGLESTRQVMLTWFVSTDYSISITPLQFTLILHISPKLYEGDEQENRRNGR